MTSNSLINALVDSLIAECHEDYEGIWVIVANVERKGIAKEPSEVRKATFDIIRVMLKRGVMAGNFHQKNPQVYRMPVDELIAMIDREWNKLGRNPTIGEIISFTAPSFLPKIMAT